MTVAELAQSIGVGGITDTRGITRLSSLEDAAPDSVVFAQDAKTLGSALATAAGVILAREADARGVNDRRVLAVADPRYAFTVCARELGRGIREAFIHPRAVVHESARLGQRVHIEATAVVEADVVLGDDVTIGAGAIISRGTHIGSRAVVQSGAVLGATGFGYVRHAVTGEYLLFPQQGTLVLEDDVEIGANSTIDRGALGETRIGRGTKIDNLVHIGHNCRIGRNVVIASGVGISGSCVIEDGAVLAGQVGLGDHCHIGRGVILGGQSGVYPGKSVEGAGEVFAGTPAEPVKEHLKSLARLRRLK